MIDNSAFKDKLCVVIGSNLVQIYHSIFVGNVICHVFCTAGTVNSQITSNRSTYPFIAGLILLALINPRIRILGKATFFL